jgi:hypothetical protein
MLALNKDHRVKEKKSFAEERFSSRPKNIWIQN